jgi:hypothetical protein
MADRLAILKAAEDRKKHRTPPGTLLDGEVLYVQHVGHRQLEDWYPSVVLTWAGFAGEAQLCGVYPTQDEGRIRMVTARSYRRTQMGHVAGTRAVECIEEVMVLLYDQRRCPELTRLHEELSGR